MTLHPAIVHFPIALLIVGTVSLLWSLLQPSRYLALALQARTGLEGFISGTLGIGFFGIVLSVATGLMDMLGSPKAQAVPNWLPIAIPHIIGAMLTLLCYGILLYRRFVLLPPAIPSPESSPDPKVAASSPDKITLALAITGLILILVVGWLGGRLVYDYRVGVN